MDSIIQMVDQNYLWKHGYATYVNGLNEFTDVPFDEFRDTYLREVSPIATVERETHIDTTWIPAMDWRWFADLNWIKVKHQGRGAHGWAFATTAALEFHYFRKTGTD